MITHEAAITIGMLGNSISVICLVYSQWITTKRVNMLWISMTKLVGYIVKETKND